MSTQTHPLALNTLVKGMKPSCQCRGAKTLPFEGKVLKVIKNHLGHWYYLDSGVTVRDQWITTVN